MANRKELKKLLSDNDNQNILLYIAAVVVLSVLLLLLHFVFTKVGDYDLSFTQYAPMLAVVLLLAVRHKDNTMRAEIKLRLKIDLKSVIYSVIIVAILAVIFVAVNYILIAIGKPFAKWGTPSIVLSLLFIMLGCIAEEIGWRGFLLPALNGKFSLVLSSVMLGVFWGVWHLNFAEGIVGFLAYTLFITTLSVIMAWVQAKNEYKLLPAVIFHFGVNLFCRLFLFGRMGWQAYLLLSAFFIGIALILFLTDKRTFLAKRINENADNI